MILLAVTTALAGGPPPGGWPPPPKSTTVASVYDGDTITLATGDKVRLKGVNTPELKPPEDYGIEAREAAKRFVDGRTVTLQLEGPNPRDGYGRIVAGIQTDQGSLAEHLVAQGLAHVFLIPPDSTDPKPLLEAQAKARAANRGIWSTDRYQGTLHITSFHANAPGDDNDNVNGEYLRVANITTEALNLDGYRITKGTGKSFAFPPLTLPAGHTVKVHSGKGEHQVNPEEQLAIFLGSPTPIWNNKSDHATIYDRFGRVVDAREHKVKSAATP